MIISILRKKIIILLILERFGGEFLLDEWILFEKKVKQYVCLDVLVQVLERDIQGLCHLKMAKEYQWFLTQVINRVLHDMEKIKKWFYQTEGKIAGIKQKAGERVVQYVYRGYRYEVKYLNEWIRVECGKLLKNYLRKGLG